MRLRVIAAIVLSLTASPHAFADDLSGADIYKKILPSVMTLEVQTADGGAIGTGFLAIKDGLAVTAWHVVKGAKSVKARFANGEVEEVTGIVDKDELADVALVRVRKFGAPLLALNHAEPEIGSKSFAIGAPKGLEFTISDGIISQIRDVNSVRNLQFTCPISPGNSGGPLTAPDGSVIGVVDSTLIDAQNVNFAIPIGKVLALDSTLPTQPWANVKVQGDATGTAGEFVVGGASADQAIRDGLIAYFDGLSAFASADVLMLKRNPFKAIGKKYFFCVMAISDALKTLESIGADPNTPQSSLVAALIDRLNCESEMLSYMNKTAQFDANPLYGWEDQTTQENYHAAFALHERLEAPLPPAFSAWMKGDYFKSNVTSSQADAIAYSLDPLSAQFGGAVFSSAPNQIDAVYDKMVCGKLGLKSSDIVLKLNDADVKSVTGLNQFIQSNAGQKVKITVERDGKVIDLKPSVPKDLPTSPFNMERP